MMHPVAQKGFARQVSLYEQYRPSYVPSLVSHLLHLIATNKSVTASKQPSLSELEERSAEPPPNAENLLSILDLAAGTGKLTRHLASHFPVPPHKITAVEPVEEMRTAFSAILPSVPILPGCATSIPLPEESCDAVTIGQAFHWFATPDALSEIARVLRPGGGLYLIWNMEDDDPSRSSWVGPLRRLYERHEQGTPQYRLGLWKHVWEEEERRGARGERAHFPEGLAHVCEKWEARVPRALVWERVKSKSYIACLDDGERERLRKEVEGVMEGVPEGEDGCIAYPHFTDLFWSHKGGDVRTEG